MVHKRVNSNDILQARRPYKSLISYWCFLCKGMENYLIIFFYLSNNAGLWFKLFRITNLGWVPPMNIGDMLTISFVEGRQI